MCPGSPGVLGDLTVRKVMKDAARVKQGQAEREMSAPLQCTSKEGKSTGRKPEQVKFINTVLALCVPSSSFRCD